MNLTSLPESPTNVTIGMVGLGRMGANIGLRAIRGGHRVIGCDRDAELVEKFQSHGTFATVSLADMVAELPEPKTVWVMVPAGDPTDSVISALKSLLSPGDCIIDGGNSYYRDDILHARELASLGIDFIDVGTSGGVWGLERGYSLMIGGSDNSVGRLTSLWKALSPGIAVASRTNTESEVTPAEEGWLHCGPHGAGHFVKMVHNGIEYALMAAYAEGFNVLKHANAGSREAAQDAETAPLNSPEMYQYSFDIPEIAEVWRRGSVVGSWLLDLTARELRDSPELIEFGGQVSDSGEGRWTSIAAIEEGVPTPVMTAALYSRFASRDMDLFANKVLNAMRKGFGGHVAKKD